MGNYLKNRRFLNIFLLISLAVFLVLPQICLADGLENIDLYEIGKHLELPNGKVESLLHSLINIFHSKWEDLMSSGYSTAEEIAVPNIMREVARAQALNHLLVDAPIEITKGIIQGAIKIAQIVLIKDFSGVLEKFEKETVQRAVRYGMDTLFQNELKVTPGAIDFKYISQKGEYKIASFQYIVIYQPFDSKSGEILIRFYSPNYLEPPENKGSGGGIIGFYTELDHNLPPFIVDIRGSVENFKWVGKPSVNIDFPDAVPDLGIRPLSFWEKQILKPIETTIKEVEIIITRITGKSPKLVDIWQEVKNFISKIKSLAPAALVGTPPAGEPSANETLDNEALEFLTIQEIEGTIEAEPQSIKEEEVAEAKPQPLETEPKGGPELTLEAIQEELDDVSERIDVLQQEPLLLSLAKQLEEEGLSNSEVETLKEVETLENEEETEENIEKIEESEELKLTKEVKEVIETDKAAIVLCEKTGEPARNRVIFNEIAWMGSQNSANDEWIELKNIAGVQVDLTGWQILDKDNQIKTIFTDRERVSIQLSAGGFFLLERTNDDSLPNIAADFIYSGALNDTEEVFYLFDENCQLQDEVVANPDWSAGEKSGRKSMERKSDLTWQTSANSDGTPKSENSSGYIVYSGGGGGFYSPPLTQNTPAEPQPSASSTSVKILITEIQIKTASSTNHDFIELYNPTTTSLDISGFQLKKRNSNGSESSIRVFPGNSTIPAQSYFLWANSDYALATQISADATSSQTLAQNNSIALFDNNGNILDALNWGTSTNPFIEGNPFQQNPIENQNIGRKWSTSTENYLDTDNNQNDFEVQIPTPRAQNQSPPSIPNQAPAAQFIFTPANPVINQEIIFDASSSIDSDGTISSYFWDFGDNTTSTISQATTSHFYSTSSNFLIILFVVDDDNAFNSATATISVTAPETPTLEVVINEIAWMGTSATNSSDEWIELFNNTTSTVNITGWHLSSLDGSPALTFSTSSVSANGFYLLERTNNDTIKDISADWMGSFGQGGLKNDGERLELRDTSNNLIDRVDCSFGWFAGTTTPGYISMERIKPNASGTDAQNWANNNLITRNGKNAAGNNINGTPKSINSVSKSETQIPLPSVLPFDEFNELTFTYLGSPYIIGNTLYVLEGKTLNIEPGVIIKFETDWGTNIRGALKAIGKEGKEIVFTSTGSRWPGIIFESSVSETEISSQLEYVKIEKARSLEGGVTSQIKVNNKAISIKNSTINNNSNLSGLYLLNSSSLVENVTFNNFQGAENPSGLYVRGGSPMIKNSLFKQNTFGINIDYDASPIIENNIFEENKTPIYFNAAYPVFSGNLAQNNNLNGIFVGPGFLTTTTWQAGLPYIIERGAVGPGSTLTLEPGVVVKFKTGGLGKGGMEIYGKILAQGTAANPVIFTSFYDDEYGGDANNDATSTSPAKGDWFWLHFSSSDSILDNSIIRYGGLKASPWWNNFGAVTVKEDVEISIRNSVIENNIYGVYLWGGNCAKIGNIHLENVTFLNNNENSNCP